LGYKTIKAKKTAAGNAKYAPRAMLNFCGKSRFAKLFTLT